MYNENQIDEQDHADRLRRQRQDDPDAQAGPGAEIFHLDTILWRPGWALPTREEQVAMQRELAGRERWIIDGNYGGTLGVRMAAADTIVLLDLPPTLCLWRVIRRRLSHMGRTRPDMAEGCIESIWLTANDRKFFSRIWQFRREGLPSIMRALGEHGEGKQVITIRSKNDIEEFVAGVHRRNRDAASTSA